MGMPSRTATEWLGSTATETAFTSTSAITRSSPSTSRRTTRSASSSVCSSRCPSSSTPSTRWSSSTTRPTSRWRSSSAGATGLGSRSCIATVGRATRAAPFVRRCGTPTRGPNTWSSSTPTRFHFRTRSSACFRISIASATEPRTAGSRPHLDGRIPRQSLGRSSAAPRSPPCRAISGTFSTSRRAGSPRPCEPSTRGAT